MPARALIIAIEGYPMSDSLVRHLPGTNENASAFRDWLIKKKNVAPASILACAGPTCAWRTTGTTHDDIVNELLKLASKWQEEDNDELYFYFSGHGFSYEIQTEQIEIDVLVGSDFITPAKSGDACLQFQELHKRLWMALGPGNHYYFIDACRNAISREKIIVPSMGKIFPVSSRQRSRYYTLYSTALGQVAKVQSGFTELLLEGLNGAGIAKRWEDGVLYVTFDRLRKYVKTKLPSQEIDARTGADQDGLIIEIDPVPEYDCDVTVVNAAADDPFTLTVSHKVFGERPYSFTGSHVKIKLVPFDYFLRVTHPSAEVIQVIPRSGPVSVYNAAVAQFKKLPLLRSPGPPATAVLSQKTSVRLNGGPSTEIRLVNDESGYAQSDQGEMVTELMPGRYVAHVIEHGVRIAQKDVIVEANKPLTIDLLDNPQTPLRRRILGSFSHATTLRYAAFSETLGDLANPDLSLWLSIFGASHIVQDPRNFSRLQHLKLDRFDDLHEGDAPVYVLFGSEQTERSVSVALSKGPAVRWQTMRRVDTLVGISELRMRANEGSHLLSLRITDESPVTLSVYCLPNRVTFVAVAEDVKGQRRIHQYILPVHTLSQYLDPRVRSYIDARPLAVIRTMALALTRFAGNQKLAPAPNTQEEDDWKALLFGEWLDPLMSLIACYEILRTGRVNQERETLSTVLANLRMHFPGLPDTEVIARHVTGREGRYTRNAPLLTDGLLLLGRAQRALRLPASRLDYSGPWTLWRGAVHARIDRSAGGFGRTNAGSADVA